MLRCIIEHQLKYHIYHAESSVTVKNGLRGRNFGVAIPKAEDSSDLQKTSISFAKLVIYPSACCLYMRFLFWFGQHIVMCLQILGDTVKLLDVSYLYQSLHLQLPGWYFVFSYSSCQVWAQLSALTPGLFQAHIYSMIQFLALSWGLVLLLNQIKYKSSRHVFSEELSWSFLLSQPFLFQRSRGGRC